MKTINAIVAIAALTTPLFSDLNTAQAADQVSSQAVQERVGGKDKFGIGLDLGYPFNGLMFNYYATERNLIQLEVGYHATPGSFDMTKDADTGLAVRGMYQGFPVVLAEGPGYMLPFFIGVGASYAFNVPESVGWFADDDTVAGSDVMTFFVPVGLQLRFRQAPVSLFAQLEPAMELVRQPGAMLRDSEVNFSPRFGLGAALHF